MLLIYLATFFSSLSSWVSIFIGLTQCLRLKAHRYYFWTPSIATQACEFGKRGELQHLDTFFSVFSSRQVSLKRLSVYLFPSHTLVFPISFILWLGAMPRVIVSLISSTIFQISKEQLSHFIK